MKKLWDMLLSIFGFGGGGSIVAAADDGLKLANTVAVSIHDKDEQASGAAKVANVQQEKTLETVQAVNDARSDPANLQRVHDQSGRD